MKQNERLETGLAIRRELLGPEAPDPTTQWDFARPFFDLITEYCYGAIWSRPELSRRDRTLVNLAMLAALNRSQELELHIALALNHGVSPEEIREVFMQIGVYCGATAGLTAFRVARLVFEKKGVVTGEAARKP